MPIDFQEREYVSENNYRKKFYSYFMQYLYKKGYHDRYVGNNIKIARSIFDYLELEKNMHTRNFLKSFYVKKASIAILVLSPYNLIQELLMIYKHP
ncbi:MAG: hypothetical protein ACJAX3_002932 [Patiriisocius sp.]|jgi:hypothetical protein